MGRRRRGRRWNREVHVGVDGWDLNGVLLSTLLVVDEWMGFWPFCLLFDGFNLDFALRHIDTAHVLGLAVGCTNAGDPNPEFEAITVRLLDD